MKGLGATVAVGILLGIGLTSSVAWAQAPVHLLPEVDLEGLEPVVAEQLARARAWTVETWTSERASYDERIERLWDLAVAWHAYELHEAAATAYGLGAEWYPDDRRWTYAGGVLALDRGRYDEAASRFATLVERNPEDDLARLRLAMARHELGNNGAAESLLREILGRFPELPVARALLGEILIEEGRHAEGVEHLRWVLARVPAADRLHYPLALGLRALGDEEGAREHLARRGGVGIRPDDPFLEEVESSAKGERLALIRGRAAFRNSRFEEAMEAFDEAVRFAPDSVRARTNRAAAFSALGDAESARRDLEAALAIEPTNPTVAFNLAKIRLYFGESTSAVQLLEQVVLETPEDLEARRLLASTLRDLGRPEAAIPHLVWILNERPGEEESAMDLAGVLIGLRRFADSKLVLESAHARNPTSGRLAGALARSLASSPDLEQRDGPRALSLAERVYEAAPTVFHAETIALALAETGRCGEAAAWMQEALDALPESADQRAAMAATAQRFAAADDRCRP